MGPDPHALAKIRIRELLEKLEGLFHKIAATNAEVSKAGLEELARLKRRLRWCDESYSRQRSSQLLDWIVRVVAQLIIRAIEASFCFQPAGAYPQGYIDDSRQRNQDSQAHCGLFPKAVCPQTQNLAVLSLFA